MTTNVISLRQLGVWVGEDQTNSYRRDADEATLPLERLTINPGEAGCNEGNHKPIVKSLLAEMSMSKVN